MSVTFYEVAQLAKVSTATVSRVLNRTGNVKPDTVDRVMEAVKVLGYYPNASAKSLAGAGTRTIGVVLPPLADLSFPDSFTLDFLNGVQTVLIERGYGLLLLDAKSDPPGYFDAYRERRIEGLIALESMVETVSHFHQMRKAGFPVALVSDFGQIEGVSRVDIDVKGLFDQGVKLLRDLGHQRICLVIYDHRPASESARMSAAQRVIKSRCRKPGSKVMYTYGLRFGLYSALLEEIRIGGYDALFVDSPQLARYALEATREIGQKIPDDLSLLALDYTSYDTKLIMPPVDALTVPSFQIGKTAAEFVFDRLEDGDHFRVERIQSQYLKYGSIRQRV